MFWTWRSPSTLISYNHLIWMQVMSTEILHTCNMLSSQLLNQRGGRRILCCVSSLSLLICFQEGKTMFEQELYHSFSISSSRPYFISFAGDVSEQPLVITAVKPLVRSSAGLLCSRVVRCSHEGTIMFFTPLPLPGLRRRWQEAIENCWRTAMYLNHRRQLHRKLTSGWV